MPLDPRFATIADHLERVRCAMLANDEQLILENLYHVREIAWDINSDILARRWEARERIAARRIPRGVVSVDNLMEI